MDVFIVAERYCYCFNPFLAVLLTYNLYTTKVYLILVWTWLLKHVKQWRGNTTYYHKFNLNYYNTTAFSGTNQNHPARISEQKLHSTTINKFPAYFDYHMTDKDTKALLQQILAKSDTWESKLHEKFNKLQNTIRAEINGIKKDFEPYKKQNFKEIKLINKNF